MPKTALYSGCQIKTVDTEKIYFVEKIPLTAVGKVDYRALEKEAEKL